MNNKVAFICPLYDMRNHFDLAFNLFKSKHDLGIKEEIYYIFSNEEQKEKFRKRIFDAFNEEIDFLILPPKELPYKSKVVVKKFFALRSLMNQYEYLSLIDSESLFVKKVDYSKLFEEIWNDGTCLNCNISPDGFFILRQCFRTMSKELYYNKILRKEFENYKYNFWFNEIPVYKCDTLPKFFNWLDTFDAEGYKNEWNCFEYYIYAAYLILFEGKHLRKFPEILSNGGVMEYLFERPIEEQRKILDTIGTHWSSNDKVTNDKTCMLFHLDRTEGEGNYSYGITREYVQNMEKARKRTLLKDRVRDLIPWSETIFNCIGKFMHKDK